MHRKIVMGLMLLTNGTCLYATAERNATMHPLMKAFDKDKDGKIFYTEASKSLQEDFCQYDVNQDAYIDEIEVTAINVSSQK